MRVGLAVLGGVVGGPASYGLRLAAGLADLGRDSIELTVFTDAPDRVRSMLNGASAHVVHVPGASGLGRLRWQYLRLRRALTAHPVDVFHDTKNALPLRCPCPSVVTVHDLAHVHCKSTFRRSARWFLAAATAHAVKGATAVIVPSAATAHDVREHWPGHGHKVHTVLHGIVPPSPPTAAQRTEVRARYHLARPYLLHVGTIQPRKNVQLICDAIPLLRQRGFDVSLVVAGRRGWMAEETLAAIETTDGACWLGPVPQEDLAPLYAEAAVFVSPSAYEGFGFTVADALAAGVPTVVSPISSLPEVVGDAGVVLQDLSVEAIADAVAELLGDPERARALGAAGRARAATFTWERAARETAAVYQSVLGGS